VADRHRRVREALDQRGVDYGVFTGPVHAVHLAGYSRYLSFSTAVVVAPDGTRTLVVPRPELAAAEASSDADTIVDYGNDDFLDLDWRPKLDAACRSLCSGLAAGADVEELAASVRRVKDDDELALIDHAVRLSLMAQERVAAGVAEGSEIELTSLAHAAAQEEAGEPIEFIGYALSGPRTAEASSPVAVPGRRRAVAGEPVLADIAVRAGGYWGDTTRTTVVGESAEVEAVVADVTEILGRIGASLRPGLRASEIFERMQAEIQERFPGVVMTHHGGHGIGVEVGEDPQLLPSVTTELEAGMVLAVEPAVYFPGRFGVRVEDDYVVTESGGRRLG
jgi:Xaa-Pro aminopeptidase